MLVKIAIILHDDSEKAMAASKRLETAVQNGEMLSVDLISEELEAMSDKGNSISIAEHYWHRFVSSVREKKINFETRYLFDVVHSKEILRLGLDREFPDITSVLNKAVETDGLVLQLPIEEKE